MTSEVTLQTVCAPAVGTRPSRGEIERGGRTDGEEQTPHVERPRIVVLGRSVGEQILTVCKATGVDPDPWNQDGYCRFVDLDGCIGCSSQTPRCGSRCGGAPGSRPAPSSTSGR